VLKFGGTSLANTKLMGNAVAKVIEEVKQNHQVIVVVSAMAGVTDNLVSLTHEIIDTHNIDSLYEYANIITTGEQVSAGLFALLLQQAGLKARSWLGWQAGIFTDEDIENGNIAKVDYSALVSSFKQGYQVAVVTGFQGITNSNRISTLGRGGSDTSAIILAGELKALKCDIYTDVEGVFTADPRIVAKAKKIDNINYDEMIELASAGAKVLQTKSVQWAKHYNVKLQVLSSFTNNPGSIISNEANSHKITGISINKLQDHLNIAKVTIIGTNIRDKNLSEFFKQTLLKESIEVLSMEENYMKNSFAVKEEDKFDAVRYLHSACNFD
ncbi:MAG: aspartate kinase, partial [Pseudomonadota bacterium]